MRLCRSRTGRHCAKPFCVTPEKSPSRPLRFMRARPKPVGLGMPDSKHSLLMRCCAMNSMSRCWAASPHLAGPVVPRWWQSPGRRPPVIQKPHLLYCGALPKPMALICSPASMAPPCWRSPGNLPTRPKPPASSPRTSEPARWSLAASSPPLAKYQKRPVPPCRDCELPPGGQLLRARSPPRSYYPNVPSPVTTKPLRS